jgi:hypothetical protein
MLPTCCSARKGKVMDDLDRELTNLIRDWKASEVARRELGVKLAASIGLLARFELERVDVTQVAREMRLNKMEGWDQLVLNAKTTLDALASHGWT